MRTYVDVNVEVDVDLDQFDTDDLIEELEDRGYTIVSNKSNESGILAKNLLEEQYYNEVKRLYNKVSLSNLDKISKFIDELK